MFSTFIQSIRPTVATALVLATFIFISMLAAPQAKAATLAELQVQISALMAQIAALQGGVPTPVSNLGSLEIGAKVVTTDMVRIRNAAGITAMYVAVQPAGSHGVIVAGPVMMGGYTWYKVDYVTGADGWNVGAFLKSTLLVTTPDVNTFVKTESGADNKMEPGLEDASIAKISISAATMDRYVNKTVLRFTPATANGEDLPWVAFENISLWSNSFKVLQVNASEMGLWKKVGNGYEITVFTGNQKLPAGRAYNLTVSVTSDTDVSVGDRWVVVVPPKGVVIWSVVHGHMTNVGNLTAYPIEFVDGGVSPVEKGEYYGYMNGKEFIHTLQITELEATSNCLLNAKSNPVSIVRCTWNGREIYDNQIGDVKPTPRFNGLEYPVDTPVAKVSAVFGMPVSNIAVVTGPANIGKISWGDGTVSETIFALIAGTQTSVARTHAYTKNGTFIITLTGLDGKTAVKKVVVTTVSTTPTVPYTLTDVKAVTKKTIDPIPGAVDDEYILYRIVLLSGKLHEVKVSGMQTITTRDAEFRKTGYIGDIAKLMAMATTVVSAGKITSFTATPAIVPATKNGSQEVVLKWTSEGTGLCTISEYIEGSKLVTLVSGQNSSGVFSVKPVWAAGSLKAEKHYVVKCANAVEGTQIEVKLQEVATPIVTAPGKNAFACDRSVTTKQATGTLACYGVWDYGDDFGGDVKVCGELGSSKTGCVIQTPVCASGAAKATAYMSNDTITTAQLPAISTRLKVTPEVAKAGIAGLWEYKCTAPMTAGAVLGASTDIYSEISKTLNTIAEFLKNLK